MSGKNLLIKIKSPAILEVIDDLPNSIDGAKGGFHPCGTWDFIIDSKMLEWCGMQFYLSAKMADSFLSSNPEIDNRLVKIRAVDDVYKDKDILEECAKNDTSHVLQIVWGATKAAEILPASEISDFWYAAIDDRRLESSIDRFATTHDYRGLAISDIDSKMDQFGLRFPNQLLVPLVDRT